MRKLYVAAFAYMILGLGSGLFYREFTKLNAFPEDGVTQLSSVHTHLLSLGVVALLVVLALEKLFALSESRLFGWFFWTYNAGLVIAAAAMTWHGALTVAGLESGPAIAGIAGIGHITMTAGFILLFLTLGRALKRDRTRADAAIATQDGAVVAA